jgi:hypothetical protein
MNTPVRISLLEEHHFRLGAQRCSRACVAARIGLSFFLVAVSFPALAHGEEIVAYIFWPLVALGELVPLLFVTRLAPRGAMRVATALVFIAASASVAWFLSESSNLTGSSVADLFVPVLAGLAVAIPSRLKSAS